MLPNVVLASESYAENLRILALAKKEARASLF